MATHAKKTSGRKPTGRKTSGTKRKKNSSSQEFPWEREVLLFVILALSIILFISNLGKGGVVGGGFSAFFFGLFGILSYVFPFVLFLVSAFLISNKGRRGRAAAYSGRVIMKTVSGILLFLFLCVFAHLVSADGPVKMTAAFSESAAGKSGGGLIGALIGEVLYGSFGLAGAFVINIIVLVVCVVLLTEHSFFRGVSKGGRKVYESAREDAKRRKEVSEVRTKQRRQEREQRRQRRMDHKVSGVAMDTKITPAGKEGASDRLSELNIEETAAACGQKDSGITPPEELLIQPDNLWEQSEPVIHMAQPDEPAAEADAAEEVPEKEVSGKEMPGKVQRRSKLKTQEVTAEVSDISQEIHDAQSTGCRSYVFPDAALLKKGDPRMVGDSRKHLQEMSAKLQMTLTNFGVNARVTNVICGPAVTQYEIQPEMGVKVSKILNLADDIKLNLAVADIRIEAPIPGKAAIGIEVPNKENVTVAFRDLIESKEFQNHPSHISFCAGKDIAGNVIVTDIAKMPHLLIAGATGSGKSVCINTIIMSILYKADPEDVKLIMIDPKVVELSVYNGIPHLFIPVVTDPKKAAGALHWAVAEMTDRYQKFAEYGVRDIKGYNKKVESVADIADETKPRKMPQIVIIVDELADLMMVAPGDVEDAICRLAQLARAAGIHLIIATQRPSVNVITGLIKANMPSRIAFSVTSGVDSRTILDMNGAEKLLGKGDMLFYPQGYQKPLRVQGAFVSDKEVSDVVSYIIEKNGQVSYNSEIEEKVKTSESSIGGGSGFTNSADDRDAYFAEAGKFIIEKEKGSIGMLQRMFKIGFNRAARIMDQLEEAGVVGPEEGTKPRKVLMTLEEFEQVKTGE